MLALRSVDPSKGGSITFRVYMKDQPMASEKYLSRYSSDPGHQVEIDEAILSKALSQGKDLAKELKKMAAEMFNNLLKEHGDRGKIVIGLFFVSLLACLIVVCYLVYQCTQYDTTDFEEHGTLKEQGTTN